MKVWTAENFDTPEIKEFPIIIKYRDTNAVLLITGKSRYNGNNTLEGTILVPNKNGERIGTHKTNWSDSNYEIYNGEVTLSNY